MPRTFQYTLHALIEEKLDLSAFDACYLALPLSRAIRGG
jgi:hypothetical protein